jgi:hypothetical protein
MIGCLLFGAGFLMMARMIHRHHHGWHHGRFAHCGPSWHGPGGQGGGGWRGHGYGGGYGYGPEGGPEGDLGGDEGPGFEHGPRWFRGGFGGGLGGGFVARVIADRLEATPAQEKVIRDATDEFRETVSKLKGEGKKTRADVASTFRKGHFDEVLFGEVFSRHDDALTQVRKGFIGMGARIHDALDEKQRARLADLIEAGPGAWRPRFRGRGWGRSY